MTPPPRERLVETLAADKAAKTSKIAGPRVVIENLLALPKGTFNILSHPVPVGQIDLLGSIFRVCCFLTSFTTAPLRKGGVSKPSRGSDGGSAKQKAPVASTAADADTGGDVASDFDFEEW